MVNFEINPEFEVQKWLNTNDIITLDSLVGKVVVVFAFQMLCPGCVEKSIPQARSVHSMFSRAGVQVLGLHTVFEHHEAMQEASLRAFLHEYKVSFPVGIDMPNENSPMPRTMEKYQMQGTPTILLFDKTGQLRKHQFGHLADLQLGAEIMALLKEEA